MTAATGDTTGDGIPDLYARDKNGVLWLVPGAGGNKIKAPVKVMTNTARFDVITGYGDITGDGKADLAVRTAASDNLYVYSGKGRSEEHTSELQSLMRISYAVFFLQKNQTHPTEILSP